MKTVIVFLLSLLVTVPVLAGAPVDGVYKSTDIGGTMLPGRYTESWFGGPRMVNNTVNEESWDGALLGMQWRWFCPWILAAPTITNDTVDGNGDGTKTWNVTYSDGTCWLSGAGPWAGGDASYTANITTWAVTLTETYDNFVLVGAVRTTQATASFLGYSAQCMNLSISNNVMVDNTDNTTLPGDYPDFWYWNPCGSIGTAGPGEWGDVTAITFVILQCEGVPVEEKSWGGVKSIYQD